MTSGPEAHHPLDNISDCSVCHGKINKFQHVIFHHTVIKDAASACASEPLSGLGPNDRS